MFIKQVQEMFYKKAKAPEDVPWHTEEPYPFVVEVIKDRNKTGKALDLGCGTGVLSCYLAKQGYEVTALDFIPRAVEMAQDRAKRQGVKINFIQTDLLTWKTRDQFDVILDSGCLHSLIGGNIRKYKEQIVSWLAPDGDYVLGHWGKRNFLDWRPIGPTRRSKESLVKTFSPQLTLVDHQVKVMEGIPLPFGPTIQGLSLLFRHSKDKKR